MEKTAEPGQIFVVLVEQHGKQPVRRQKTDKPSFAVNHCQRAFAMLHRLPGGFFLIDAQRYDRRVSIHDLADYIFGESAKKFLDPEHADELAVGAYSDVRGAFEMHALQRLP